VLTGICALLAAVAIPIGGKLGDRFGRRRMCLWVGYIRILLMTSCAIPTSGPVFFVMYCIARTLGGVMSAFPAAILSDVTNKEERPRFFGIYGGINGAAFVFGLFLGGVIVDYLGGLSAFVLFAPFGLTALILITRFFPNKPSENPAPIDVRGMVLMTLGVGSVLVWCSFGGRFFSRTSPFGIALLVAGAVFLWLLFRVEQKVPDPLINLKMFRMKPLIISFSGNLLIAPMMSTFSSVLILFGEHSLGLSATVCGTLALPKNIMFALVPPLLGAWLAKDHSRFRITFLGAGIFLTAGCVIASFWNTSTPVLTIYLSMLVLGVGTCCQTVSIQPYTQVKVPQKDLGVATAMVSFANSFGVVIFNVVYNMVYNPRYNAAVELGAETHLPAAMTEIFSIMCVFSAFCCALIVVLTLILVPRKEGKRVNV